MIYFMRHGQDDENYIGGWSDVELIQSGINDAELVGEWINNNLNITKIICSDVRRAVHTSLIINKYLNVPLEESSLFREQSKGDLNGMLKVTAKELYPEYFKDVKVTTVYPNGECLKDLYNKVKQYISKLSSIEDDTLIVTHRGYINMLYYILNDIPLDMKKERFDVVTASVHEYDKENNTIRRIK